jgi:outer membrane protein W
MVRTCPRFAIVTLAVIALLPAFAGDDKNKFRFCATHINPTGDLTYREQVVISTSPSPTAAVLPVMTLVGEIKAEPDAATGLMVGYERELTPLIGLDFGVRFTNHDVDLDSQLFMVDTSTGMRVILDQDSDTGDMDVMPVTMGVNFHLLNSDRYDLYVGPAVAYVSYGDFKQSGEPDLEIDDEFGWAGVVGLDVGIGDTRQWSFTVAARYMDADADINVPAYVTGDQEIDVTMDMNSFSVDVGFGVRF